jgi:hypothetical protein
MMFDLILDVMNGFLAKIGSIVPLGRGYFSSSFQALRAWLLSCCPSRDKIHSTAEALPKLAFMG